MLSWRLLSWASEALLQEPGFELLIKVALDPKGTSHLIDLGDRCLPQQWAQKIFHILLQGLGEDDDQTWSGDPSLQRLLSLQP